MRESPSVQLMEMLRKMGRVDRLFRQQKPVFPVMREHSFDLALGAADARNKGGL